MPAPLKPRDLKTRNVALVRVLRLMRMLRQPATIHELAEQLGVTTRTVRRDLELLNVVGVKVWRSFETNCWQLEIESTNGAGVRPKERHVS